MSLRIQIFGGYRYQLIQDEFNAWAKDANPYVVKTIMSMAPVPRGTEGHSLYFTLTIFYNTHQECPEEYKEGRP